MLNPWKTGASFGMTSGVITTLGLIVGLNSGTHSRLAVIGGILTIAVADSMSDALGMHVAEESSGIHGSRHIWTSTFATFITKLIIATSFIVPVLMLDLAAAVWASIAWGLAILALLSYAVARHRGAAAWHVIGEHVLIALAVVAATYYLGLWIAAAFGA